MIGKRGIKVVDKEKNKALMDNAFHSRLALERLMDKDIEWKGNLYKFGRFSYWLGMLNCCLDIICEEEHLPEKKKELQEFIIKAERRRDKILREVKR